MRPPLREDLNLGALLAEAGHPNATASTYIFGNKDSLECALIETGVCLVAAIPFALMFLYNSNHDISPYKAVSSAVDGTLKQNAFLGKLNGALAIGWFIRTGLSIAQSIPYRDYYNQCPLWFKWCKFWDNLLAFWLFLSHTLIAFHKAREFAKVTTHSQPGGIQWRNYHNMVGLLWGCYWVSIFNSFIKHVFLWNCGKTPLGQARWVTNWLFVWSTWLYMVYCTKSGLVAAGKTWSQVAQLGRGAHLGNLALVILLYLNVVRAVMPSRYDDDRKAFYVFNCIMDATWRVIFAYYSMVACWAWKDKSADAVGAAKKFNAELDGPNDPITQSILGKENLPTAGRTIGGEVLISSDPNSLAYTESSPAVVEPSPPSDYAAMQTPTSKENEAAKINRSDSLSSL